MVTVVHISVYILHGLRNSGTKFGGNSNKNCGALRSWKAIIDLGLQEIFFRF